MSSVTSKLLFVVATVAVNAGLSTVLIQRSELAQQTILREALRNRPPVAVLAPSSFVAGAQAKEEIEAGLKEAFAAADKLRDAGYLVLDDQTVLNVPEHLKVARP